MDKRIVLKMLRDEEIKIFMNDVEKIVISKDKREITAEEIYNLLEHQNDDKYNISIEPEGTNDKVIIFFKDLLVEITKKIS